jgi:hypothetical protein
VAAKTAAKVGEEIKETQAIAPVPMFFDKVTPMDPLKPLLVRGEGHFIVENYILYYPLKAVGVRMERFGSAELTTARWLFDGLFPFLCLIVLSLLTPATAPERAPAFYAKMKTPVAPTAEQDHEEIEKNHANPRRFDHLKLFPNTNWEFAKWTKQDYLGFFGCYGVVVAILGVLWLVLHIGT